MNYQQRYGTTPMGKYIRQRSNARARFIDWLFTFDSWWKVWEESGKWEERGRNPGNYYMCRKGDTGPYSPDNVEIKTISENVKDTWKYKKDIWGPTPTDWWVLYPRTSAWDYPHENLDKLKSA